jgi:hypothetical protein
MFNRSPGLTVAKEAQLQRALNHLKGETYSGNSSLQTLIHPLTSEFGYTLTLPTPEAGSSNLIIVQQKDTGIVQFVFPVHSAQPLLQAMPETRINNFGFIRPLQLGRTLLDDVKWVVRAALNIPHEIEIGAVLVAARAVEQLNKNEGLISLSRGYDQPVTTNELQAVQGQRVLLFVHGIFSSTQGAFSELGDPASKSTMCELVKTYSGRVFGYDHWTISKTPLENALNLLDAIPEGANWDIDVVCHSRGGLVVRSLLSVIRDGAALANEDLRLVTKKRAGKIRNVGKVFFVAAANQGSPLADLDEIRDFLNLAAFLASKTECFALDVVIGLARAVVSASFDLPSVEALSSKSTLVQDLNRNVTLMANANIFGVRADFDHAQSVLLEGGVLLDKLLMRVDNDLVVPYAGVAAPNPNIAKERLLQFGNPEKKQGLVWHTEFFEQQDTHNFLGGQLIPGWSGPGH